MKRFAMLTSCLAAIGTAGCAAQAPQTTVVAVTYDPMEPAAAVAQLLVEADQAQDEPKRLGRLIAAIEGLGARPADPTGDPLTGWRKVAEMPQTPPYRGRVLGPAYKAGMLTPGATVRLPQLFDGGRAARVAVATPGQAGLDFTVLDGEAKPVCPPAKARNRQCTWTPLYSGRFEIVLSNSSTNAAGYYLVID
ncbi:hypothetical protein OVA07_03850 [Novosphingobium sp. SL115]|uniref:hypothetical protein n=1 Tax=Novosphingobium sp. SL115 TaxID=2995150 RepID=UPI00227385AB|nr:hypothetical protein [Novosphingobium sp. SL115]MCY1670141.1 hypothetical protein [Novosphingobium sp. SL115]